MWQEAQIAALVHGTVAPLEQLAIDANVVGMKKEYQISEAEESLGHLGDAATARVALKKI